MGKFSHSTYVKKRKHKLFEGLPTELAIFMAICMWPVMMALGVCNYVEWRKRGEPWATLSRKLMKKHS